jgi:serine/threonine protein kinase
MSIQLAANVVIAERFQLNRQLGRGGMGSVWHATHLGLDVPCAVKFIEGENSALPEAQARFEREAKAAAALRSPHVVQILDHGVWQGTPYIAMELLDGEELGKRLIRLGRLSPPEAVRIVSQVCRALTKAHSVRIVHRDLKPDNIFLVRDDDREIAKVLDFGIAKATNNAIEGSNTKTGAMLGTPYYMSPEQAQGTKAVDHRSDLWSLGVIVYQMVTGRLPFESEALGDLLVKIIVSPIPIPSEVAPWVPLAFNAWWARAAQRDPGARFQSAKEFADSLSMAFGQSQGTDVMERPRGVHDSMVPPGQTQGDDARRSNPPPGFGRTPPGAGTLAITPNPALHPSNMPPPMGGTTPRPFQQTPGQPTTGAPMSRTFGGGAASIPEGRKPPPMAAIAGIVAAVLVIGGVATAFAVRGKSGPATAGTTETPPAAVTVPATATVTAPPTATLEPPPVAAASSQTVAPGAVPGDAAGTAPADTSAKTAHPFGTGGAPPATVGKPPPATTGKKKQIDLGI